MPSGRNAYVMRVVAVAPNISVPDVYAEKNSYVPLSFSATPPARFTLSADPLRRHCPLIFGSPFMDAATFNSVGFQRRLKYARPAFRPCPGTTR
ncbi:hypothetical protein [Deinococcus sedimenti]|uniref:Uncharacterized protein n=1 Tax=Deinococcus sedimenti TaxID=1867090 RepID=A0ABQ2S334_9DEIO|nr:hypothetical protein [Deinococcus sedimenti]GGR83541.1 hypothetical protein GCM10008960_08260 [Deinococcus sedimenti]